MDGNVSFKCPLKELPYYYEAFHYISREQIGDEIDDCVYGIDEICAWKTVGSSHLFC